MKRQETARPRFGRVVFRPGILRETDTVAALEGQCKRIRLIDSKSGFCEGFISVEEAKTLANRVFLRVDKHERDLTGIVKAMIPVLRQARFVKEERRAA